MEKDELAETVIANAQAVEKLEEDAFTVQNEDLGKPLQEVTGCDGLELDNRQDDISDQRNEIADLKFVTHEGTADAFKESNIAQMTDESRDFQCDSQQENLEASTFMVESCDKVPECTVMESEMAGEFVNIVGQEHSGDRVDGPRDFESKSSEGYVDNFSGQNDLAKEMNESRSLELTQNDQKKDEIPAEDNNLEPDFDGKEVVGMEASRSTSTHYMDADQDTQGVIEKAVALKNFVRQTSAAAVSTLLHRLSGKSNEGGEDNSDEEGNNVSDSSKGSDSKEISQKTAEGFAWNLLNYIKMSSDVNVENKTEVTEQRESIIEGPSQPIPMKGRIILYTSLGCEESKQARRFLYMKRLRYVEINIDVYPGRRLELERISGSTSVPKVFFNEIFIGGLRELKALDESGKLSEKIDFLITEAPSFEAPLPPLSGEDDVSSNRALDEMALIICKMKDFVVVKDRFYKMRRFTKCFLGSEAVDFLSEDQYLERQEAVEFARKLASKLFFQHVLDENLFEDGNHLYRFLDDDPIVSSQCHNIPRGITTVKPKSVSEIASRLRFLSYAMFEAYASEDGRHVDYRSIHGSEEFARYLRIVEELQRAEVWLMSREEKLAFFINLYNMMAIHAILVLGHPAGALERRKLFGDFKYVIGGSTYSLSDIQNGILRGNQRPPYNLMKPFGAKDRRLRVALPYPEPLIHFALVCGTRSGPALQYYSPGDIDQELMDVARKFLRSGGFTVDLNAKVAYACKILEWFSIDFGKNEVEVMKHVSNYLDPADSAMLLDLLATSELKVIYQPYDWGLNC